MLQCCSVHLKWSNSNLVLLIRICFTLFIVWQCSHNLKWVIFIFCRFITSPTSFPNPRQDLPHPPLWSAMTPKNGPLPWCPVILSPDAIQWDSEHVLLTVLPTDTVYTGQVSLQLLWGPRHDYLNTGATSSMLSQTVTVLPLSDNKISLILAKKKGCGLQDITFKETPHSTVRSVTPFLKVVTR